jgi:hypothetical protein
MIAGAVADFAETAMQTAFQPPVEIAMSGMKARFAKFGPRFEACLASNDGGFCVGDPGLLSFSKGLDADKKCQLHFSSGCPGAETGYVNDGLSDRLSEFSFS